MGRSAAGTDRSPTEPRVGTDSGLDVFFTSSTIDVFRKAPSQYREFWVLGSRRKCDSYFGHFSCTRQLQKLGLSIYEELSTGRKVKRLSCLVQTLSVSADWSHLWTGGRRGDRSSAGVLELHLCPPAPMHPGWKVSSA